MRLWSNDGPIPFAPALPTGIPEEPLLILPPSFSFTDYFVKDDYIGAACNISQPIGRIDQWKFN